MFVGIPAILAWLIAAAESPATGDGLRVGDRRSVHFAHGEHHSGTLSLEIVESTPKLVRFSPVGDDSYLTHWLGWRESVVELEQTSDGRTRVRWTLRYWRRLDPSGSGPRNPRQRLLTLVRNGRLPSQWGLGGSGPSNRWRSDS